MWHCLPIPTLATMGVPLHLAMCTVPNWPSPIISCTITSSTGTNQSSCISAPRFSKSSPMCCNSSDSSKATSTPSLSVTMPPYSCVRSRGSGPVRSSIRKRHISIQNKFKKIKVLELHKNTWTNSFSGFVGWNIFDTFFEYWCVVFEYKSFRSAAEVAVIWNTLDGSALYIVRCYAMTYNAGVYSAMRCNAMLCNAMPRCDAMACDAEVVTELCPYGQDGDVQANSLWVPWWTRLPWHSDHKGILCSSIPYRVNILFNFRRSGQERFRPKSWLLVTF